MGASSMKYLIVAYLIQCTILPSVHGQLAVTSLPAVLFAGGSQTVVEGSAVWLYCVVNSTDPTLTVTWNKDDVPVVLDVPHLRTRRTSTTSSTTLLLVVENFQPSDNGTYQCSAQVQGESTVMGSILTLTAFVTTTGSLQIISYNGQDVGGSVFRNSTGIMEGAMASPNYDVGHVGDNITSYVVPGVTWLKDGEVAMFQPINIPLSSNGQLRTTLSFTMMSSDAGVYQCVFTDTARSEVFVTTPIKIDTGETLAIEAVSPTTIILRPPEPLVLQVRATGRYSFIEWRINGVRTFTPITWFVHFGEIYVRGTTNASDLGLYEVRLAPNSGQAVPDEVEFIVIEPANASTTSMMSGGVVVTEGGSVDINCTSTGVPVPTIIWTLNNQPAPFTTTAVSTEPSVRFDSNLYVTVTHGRVSSTLHIEVAQYPAHDGAYVCIGTNSYAGVSSTSTVMITVQVQVAPEVDLVADRTRVALWDRVTLTCNVTRANPPPTTYTWTNEDTNTTLSETSNTLTLLSITMTEVATFRCEATNAVGTGMDCTITIELGVAPSVTTRASPPGPVVLGTMVDLVCEATAGDTPISFSWSGVAVLPGDTDGTISVTLSSAGDYGTYTCTAVNDIGNGTATVDVIQATFPNVSLSAGQSASPEVMIGEDLTLSVSISDFNLPLTSITWRREGTVLTNNANRVTITPSTPLPTTTDPVTSTLVLTSAIPLDSGRYDVTATNPAGNNTLSFTGTVGAAVNITAPTTGTTMAEAEDEGNTVMFTCNATGVPAPSISWSPGAGGRISIMNGSLVTDSNGVISISSTLTIFTLEREDAGDYNCMANNGITSATRTFTFNVNFAPTITVPPVSTVQHLVPAPLSLNCTAEGYPQPTITWVRTLSDGSETEFSLGTTVADGRNFTVTTNPIPMATMVESVFTITPAVVLDAANYTCRAVNSVGQSTSTSTVTVYAGPVITTPTDSQLFTTNEQTSITFTCTATGIPAPSLSFQYGSDTLTRTDGEVGIGDSTADRVQVGMEVMSAMVDAEGLYTVTRDLTLFDARDQDTGTFSCTASANIPGHGMQTDMVSFNLTVLVGPVITSPPLSQTVVAGSNVTFMCSAMGLPRPNITWFALTDMGPVDLATAMVSIVVTSSGERMVTSTLIDTNTQPIMALTYSCNATNVVSASQSTAILTVHTMPEIVFPPENFVVTENQYEMVTITCSAVGIPPPAITWRRQDGQLGSSANIADIVMAEDYELSDGRGVVFRVNRTLMFMEVMDGDSGNYTCVVNNTVGMVERDFQLSVQVAANITRPPENTTITAPNAATFNCTASGLPRPNITWLDPSSTPLVSATGSGVIIMEVMEGDRELVSTLTLNTTAVSGRGEYTCQTDNGVTGRGDVTTASATLIVHLTPVVTSVYPDSDQLNYTVNMGDPVTFQCVATGIPVPSIIWFRNGTELMDSRVGLNPPDAITVLDGMGQTVYQSTRTLTLGMTEDEDSGVYECRASNAAMPRENRMPFELIVQIPPEPPVISVTNLTVTQPGAAMFECTAMARPRPSITWYRVENNMRTTLTGSEDGVTITMVDGNTERSINSTLLFSPSRPSFSAMYLCVATNPVGSAQTNVTLTVHVTPVVTSVYPDSDQLNYTVNMGGTVTFQCVATGIPAPYITWFRNGTELMDSRVGLNPPDVITVLDGMGQTVYQSTRTLTLGMTEDEDSGVYECRASNAAMPGEDRMSFEMIVQIPPSTLIADSDITVTQPEAAMFECTAMARPRPFISWYRVEADDLNMIALTGSEDGVSITVRNGNADRIVASTLTFSPSRPFFSGMYICEATNPVDTAETDATLTVYVVPNITSFVPAGGRYVVNVSDPVTFQCAAIGVPAPTIQWFRGVVALNPSTDSRVVLSEPTVAEPPRALATVGRTLTISNTFSNDSDTTYSCRASNAASGGMDTEMFELFVQVPPVAVSLTQRVVANVSESAVLSFRIDNANPPVMTSDLHWYYTASTVSGDPDFTSSDFLEITTLMNRTSTSRLTYSGDLLTLNVSNIVQAIGGQETDAGRYFLRATNPAGDSSNYIDLVVRGPPQIVGGPRDQFVINNGSSAVFECTANADPQHEVAWSFISFNGEEHKGIAVTSVAEVRNYSVNRNRSQPGSFGELTVSNVMFDDRGTYMCTARNDIGEETAQANLTVHVIPVVRNISQPRQTPLHVPVAIFCLLTGYPIPTITWQQDAASVAQSERIGMFTFLPRLDSGNRTDFTSPDSEVGSITDLLMMHSRFTVDNITSLGELGVVGVLRIDSVERGDTGSYTCAASNQLPQTTVFTATSSAVPLIVLERPDPPVSATIFAVGPRWIALRWTPTFDGNSPVLTFIPYIRNVNMTEEFVPVENLTASELMTSGSSFMYNVSRGDVVLPFTVYSFTVVSCNEIGCSNQSRASDPRQTLEDTSSPPLNPTVTDRTIDTITLQWQQPMMSNGIILSYIISVTGDKNYNSSFSDTREVTRNVSELRMSGNNVVDVLSALVPGTRYRFTVVAVNGAMRENGVSMRSESVTDFTESAPPPAPVIPIIGDAPPTLSTEEDDDVRTWVLPFPTFSTINGPISHYQVIVIILPIGQTMANLDHPDTMYDSIDDFDEYRETFCDEELTTAKAYITTEFAADLIPNSGLFVVGGSGDNSPNDRTMLYSNSLLCYSKQYTFFVRAYPLPITQSGSTRRSVRQADASERQYREFASSDYYASTTIAAAPAPVTGIVLPANEVQFQLRFVGITDCDVWITESPVVKAAEVIQAVVEELRERCQCVLEEGDLISNAGFSCFEQSPTAVTFRAVLTGTPQISASELISFLETWISSGAFLSLQAQVLSVDRSCAVVISSFGDSECNTQDSSSSSGLSGTVIGSLIAVVVVVILSMAVILVLLVLVVKKNRSKSFKLQTPSSLPPQPYEQVLHLSEMSGSVKSPSGYEEDPHVYDRISITGANTGGGDGLTYDEVKPRPTQDQQPAGMELTSCPAYGLTLKSTAPASTRDGEMYDEVKPLSSDVPNKPAATATTGVESSSAETEYDLPDKVATADANLDTTAPGHYANTGN